MLPRRYQAGDQGGAQASPLRRHRSRHLGPSSRCPCRRSASP
jgi:hypothetical protein